MIAMKCRRKSAKDGSSEAGQQFCITFSLAISTILLGIAVGPHYNTRVGKWTGPHRVEELI